MLLALKVMPSFGCRDRWSSNCLVVYPAVVGIMFKFVLIDDFLGEYAEFDLRILWLIKRSV